LNVAPIRIALCACWLLAGILWQVCARADDPLLEQVVVTGTRIARPNVEAASPIVAVPATAFERTASSAVENTLNRYPQFVPSYTGTSNNTGLNSYSSGQASLNLRGLGENRTLTLIEGRRLVPVNGNGETDLNVIPPTLIESVEIVTGGASAVYGSDAIAGVVNFRLRPEFDGVELGGRWGQTDRGDGEEYEVSMTAGTDFADGRGSVIGHVGYYDRAQINQPAREFSRAPLFYLGPGEGNTGPDNAYLGFGSDATEEGVAFLDDPSNAVNSAVFDALFESYGYSAGSVPQIENPIGFNTDGTVFTTGNFDFDSVANFRGQGDPLTSHSFRHTYNFAEFVALQMPQTRKSAYASATFDLTEGLELYAAGIYADYTVNTQLAPVPLQNVFMPASNPFIPPDLKRLLDSRPDPDEPFPFAKRLTVNGPRVQENNYDMYQLTAGARGSLPNDWDFDVYAQYGASSQWKHQTGNVSRSKVEELTFAPDGGESICGGFSPFGLDSVLPACADYIAVDAGIDAEVRQLIAEFSAHGTPLTLPAGELRMAIGLQYRSDEYQYRADDALRLILPDGLPDIVGIEAADDIDADDQNTDIYIEAAIPLRTGARAVESLETVLGFRHSDYASAGGVDAWKAELLYRPATAVRLRGSYQRAVRVPSIFELFLPGTRSFAFVFEAEPCSVNSRQRNDPQQVEAVESLCIEQGVPAELLPDFFEDGIDTTVVGNPNLDPESADTFTAGIVVQPEFESRWIRDMQFTIDWYRIEIDEVVTFIDAISAVESCFDPTLNPAFAADNYWCTLFGRDPGTGEIVDAVDSFYNLATSTTTGVDFQLDWRLPIGPGTLGVGWYVGWLNEYNIRTTSEATADEFAGTVGGFAGSYPEWKWLMDLRYAWRDLEVGLAWQYVDATRDTSRSDFKTTDWNVPHRNYFALDATYAFDDGWFDGLTIRTGVENLTDESAPVFPNSVAANTDPSQFDVLGRRYYVTLAVQF
jgi:outer membrane receptor protein involved in Fe transport